MDEQNKFAFDAADTIDPREMMLEEQNRCCLCGSDLVFKHDVDYHSLTVQEHADCPTCKIKMKTKQFGLN